VCVTSKTALKTGKDPAGVRATGKDRAQGTPDEPISFFGMESSLFLCQYCTWYDSLYNEGPIPVHS
jgi:hypothetical protein